MDHAQEAGLWRAVGACEQDSVNMQDQIDRLEARIVLLHLRDRLAFVLVLMFGLAVGVVGGVGGAWQTEAEAQAWKPTTYLGPGPYGIDPKPPRANGAV